MTIGGRPGEVLAAIMCFAAPFISRGVTILWSRQQGEEPPDIGLFTIVVWIFFVGSGLYNVGLLLHVFA